MSWDATGGAVVEDDRGRRYEGVWVSASARDVNSAPLPALAPVGRPPGFFVFYYKDIGQYLTHDLHLDEHGITKSWVIISKN